MCNASGLVAVPFLNAQKVRTHKRLQALDATGVDEDSGRERERENERGTNHLLRLDSSGRMKKRSPIVLCSHQSSNGRGLVRW